MVHQQRRKRDRSTAQIVAAHQRKQSSAVVARSTGVIPEVERIAALVRVELAAETIRSAEQGLREAVADARRWHATWGEVGRTLGVSAQAAHKRFTR